MEANNIPIGPAPAVNKFTENDIPRCPKCNLISSLNLMYKNGEPFINYSCENLHEGNILLKDYFNESKKFSLLKEICNECNSNQNESKGQFVYCTKCKIFLCHLCEINHEEHNLIKIKRYDATCKIHANFYSFYCIRCKTNICVYCQSEHKGHELINLFEINFSEESKTNLRKNISDLESKIKNLDNLKKTIEVNIENFKQFNQLEINFLKILLSTYEYEEKQKNLNYFVINNLKKFDEKFKSINLKNYEKLFNETNNYITLLQNMTNKKRNINTLIQNYKPNVLTKCIKTIKAHSGQINYLDILNDGRLMSASSDKTLKIYKKNTFEIQVLIQVHKDRINSFTQLLDEKIISCSDDGTMNIIKIIDEDKYQIEQTLEGHNNYVIKVIETNNGELISICYDCKLMKWKLDKENKYISVQNINFQDSNSDCNIIKVNDKEFATLSRTDNYVKFWDFEKLTNISTIHNIESELMFQNMCMLEDDILIIGGDNSFGFYFIKISNHQIIKNIRENKKIFSIHKCLNGNILCSVINDNGNQSLIKYKYENESLVKIVEREKAHNNNIYSCIELGDGTIVSAGIGGLIKIWG